jgi:hypothetical protein
VKTAPEHIRVHETALIDSERTGDEFVGGDPLRAAGLLVEAQGLVGDDRDAAQLMGPTGVRLQSNAWVRRAISPVP